MCPRCGRAAKLDDEQPPSAEPSPEGDRGKSGCALMLASVLVALLPLIVRAYSG